MQVCIESSLTWRNACSNGCTKSVCKFKSNLALGILQEKDQSKLYINVPHFIVEGKFDTFF